MRREEYVTLGKEHDRDAGKVFVITEMSADQCEEWAFRALAGCARSLDIPDLEEGEELSTQQMARMGFDALSTIPWTELKPLLDEMMLCVKIAPDPTNRNITRPLVQSDTEEVMTRLRLRKEVWNIHTGFLKGVVSSRSTKGSRRTAAA